VLTKDVPAKSHLWTHVSVVPTPCDQTGVSSDARNNNAKNGAERVV
jgi:hypothetical protein